MHRRVARVVRTGLFALGIAALLWLPTSFLFHAVLQGPWLGGAYVASFDGAIRMTLYDKSEEVYIAPYRGIVRQSRGPSWDDLYSSQMWVPSFNRYTLPAFNRNALQTRAETRITLPLWLLAFICLAWPVTSLLIARRRQKRGFPVSVAPLPLGEVPSEVASGDRDEAERASARTS